MDLLKQLKEFKALAMLCGFPSRYQFGNATIFSVKDAVYLANRKEEITIINKIFIPKEHFLNPKQYEGAISFGRLEMIIKSAIRIDPECRAEYHRYDPGPNPIATINPHDILILTGMNATQKFLIRLPIYWEEI